MEISTLWWLGALALVLLELLSGTFYLLMLALGAVAAALGAHLGASLNVQLVLAALVGVGAATLWHLRRTRQRSAPADSLHLDLGQELVVDHWGEQGQARIRYRGADWVATLAPGQPMADGGRYRVAAIEGSRLVLEAV